MPPTAYFLSEADRAVMREMIADWRRRKRSTTQRPAVEPSESPSATVYVALTPSGGIPALVEGADTGTAFGDGDQPGSAFCDIYQLDDDSDTPELLPADMEQQLVYNLSTADVDGASWITAVHDEFGNWFALPTAVGASSGSLTVEDDNGHTVTGVGTILFDDVSYQVSSLTFNTAKVVPRFNGIVVDGAPNQPILNRVDTTILPGQMLFGDSTYLVSGNIRVPSDRGGLYLVGANVTYQGGAGIPIHHASLGLYVSGFATGIGVSVEAPNSFSFIVTSDVVGMAASGIWQIPGNQVFSVRVTQDSGATMGVSAGATRLWLYRLKGI